MINLEKNKYNVFLSTEGLTSTSANHIANIAKEKYMAIEEELSNLSYTTKTVSLLSSTGEKVIHEGNNSVSLSTIEHKLIEIANLKSLIAWLREGLKAKENLQKEIRAMDINDYFDEVPEAPVQEPVLTEDEYLSSLSVKDRNRYYYLETLAAVIGKYIHPGSHFAAERKDYHNKLRNPHTLTGTGADTIIYSYTPTVTAEELDATYFDLQAKQREYQAELNGIKHKMEIAITEDSNKKHEAYHHAYADYIDVIKKLRNEFSEWQQKELQRVSGLKIVIPNTLLGIYNSLK